MSFAILMGAAACGTSTNTSSGGAALSVSSADAPPRVASQPPGAGKGFVELTVTLANSGSPSALPVNFVLFGLATSQSLVITPSPVSGSVSPACAPDTSVAPGGSFTCDLVFEVPKGQTGTELQYNDQLGHTATASVPAIQPPTPCEQLASWFVGSQPIGGPCLTCLEGHCQSEAAAESAACPTSSCSCADAGLGTPKDACACRQACETASCSSATQTWETCEVSACASSCN